MRTRTAFVPLVAAVCTLAFAAFLMIPAFADAGRGDQPRGISQMLLDRLCERQRALGDRLGWSLVHPAFCEDEPEPEPDEPTVEITADPMTITEGGSSEISWNSDNAESCEASGGWSGAKSTEGSAEVSPIATTIYTITCDGDGGEASDSVTVTVEDAEQQTATLTLVKQIVNDDGGSATSTDWTLSADGPTDISGVTGSSAVTDAVVEAGTYTLSESGGPGGYAASEYSCSVNGGATVSGNSITLADEDVATCTITNDDATGTLIVRKVVIRDDGDSTATTTFSFQIDGGTAIAFEEDGENSFAVEAGAYDVTEVAASGYTTSYTDCTDIAVANGETEICVITNNDSAIETATLTLVKVIVNDDGGNAEADDWTLHADGPTDISGTSGSSTVTNATVEAGEYVLSEDGGPNGYTGSIYSCQKNDGPDVLGNSITLEDGDSAVCTVTNDDNEPDAPTVNLVAAPTTVFENSAGGATTTLTWTTTNATSCTASGGTFTGSKATSSTEVITPTATTTYMLVCDGFGGTATDTVEVFFVPEGEPVEEGTLVISEVLYDVGPGQGVEAGHEWIEIFNGTHETLNLSGYFLRDNSASEIFVLPQDTMLASGASLLVTGASSTAPSSGFWSVPGNTTWIEFSGFSNQLANTGDFVELFNTASSSVDAVCWGPEDNAFDCDALLVDNQGESIGRIDRLVDTGTVADWQIQSPNPGE